MRRVPLTNGGYAIVDTADFKTVSRCQWRAYKSPKARVIYARCEATGEWMHRYLMGLDRFEFTSEGWKLIRSPLVVDHIDFNGLNNQRSNLRIVTNKQNATHSRPRLNGGSRFKGVHWVKRNLRWRACVRADGVLHYLGMFRDEEEAARAYDAKARELFAEFAYLTFPDAAHRELGN